MELEKPDRAFDTSSRDSEWVEALSGIIALVCKDNESSRIGARGPAVWFLGSRGDTVVEQVLRSLGPPITNDVSVRGATHCIAPVDEGLLLYYLLDQTIWCSGRSQYGRCRIQDGMMTAHGIPVNNSSATLGNHVERSGGGEAPGQRFR